MIISRRQIFKLPVGVLKKDSSTDESKLLRYQADLIEWPVNGFSYYNQSESLKWKRKMLYSKCQNIQYKVT